MASRRHSAAEHARLPAQRCRWHARLPARPRDRPLRRPLRPAAGTFATRAAPRGNASQRKRRGAAPRQAHSAHSLPKSGCTRRLTNLHAVLRNKTKKNASYCVKRHERFILSILRPRTPPGAGTPPQREAPPQPAPPKIGRPPAKGSAFAKGAPDIIRR